MTPATAILPNWFRGALIALVTLLMCSCSAPVELPSSTTHHLAPSDSKPIFRGQSPVVVAAGAGMETPSDANVEPAGCLSCLRGPSADNSCSSGACADRGCTANANCRSCLVPGGEPLGPPDEYLCDGGDGGTKAGVRADLTITGLELEDTVVHYDGEDGAIHITQSNCVCIYAPRFGAVRRVVNVIESNQRDLVNVVEEDTSLAAAETPLPPVTAIADLPPVIKVGEDPASVLRNREQAGELLERVVIREVIGLVKPYSNLSIVKLGIADNAEKPWLAQAIVSALTWTGDQAPQVTIEEKAASVLISTESPGVIYASPQGKPHLRLVKLASTGDAQLGEEVEFTLRVDNVGTDVARNVTIADNLTARLQYVPESAEASVEAEFKTSRNEAGSLVLKWRLAEPIKPGEGAVMTFRVKVI